MRRRILLLCLIVVPLWGQEIALEFDPARTQIDFSLGDLLHKVHGSFQLKRGSIRFDPAGGKASGEFVVDVTSGDSGSGARDRRMHKDILESQRYPQAVFTPDRIEGRLAAEGSSEVDIHGQFRIHGADHEMTLHAQVTKKGDEITAVSRFTVPYVKWGMKNPSSFILRVSDHVEIEVHGAGRLRAPVAAPPS
jgi:polyisoprenoid-binding protein YceI